MKFQQWWWIYWNLIPKRIYENINIGKWYEIQIPGAEYNPGILDDFLNYLYSETV